MLFTTQGCVSRYLSKQPQPKRQICLMLKSLYGILRHDQDPTMEGFEMCHNYPTKICIYRIPASIHLPCDNAYYEPPNSLDITEIS